MKRGSTIFLKIAIFLLGLPILAICIYGLTRFDPNSPYWQGPELASLQYPLLIGMYAAMIPFFFALYQTLKLLSYIDKNEAFSEASVKALKRIKYSAIAIVILFVLELPFLYILTKVDDAPGVLMGLFVIFASTVIAVFAAVLQRLLQDAIDIKAENDLIV
ncbi:DUF2975 domain-containing protein [Planococcus shenhongbingii]|uniref:DUF2975 domain-containing protein n=1 Tax=Planococcus shenhongbingii TaxID=3058398 RepID=A0ABT8NBI1_9BACL|nr:MULTISPECIES: DUF2975 domain-containing protein [unclassified Planococcus (in: firmicutes)]MDN7245246.1 DUF2975 domain-containing protein [Planococcus sp. N017]WKA58354.1 DUF2975 domain-containing protein [Planococcus sp. N016]